MMFITGRDWARGRGAPVAADRGGYSVASGAARTASEQGYLGAATRVSARLTDVRLCRNECFIRAHMYTRTGILTHTSRPCRRSSCSLSIVLVGNQIADSVRLAASWGRDGCGAQINQI